MSKNFSRSFSCSRSQKIYIRSNKIKLGSTYAYHALWPLSYDLDKIQDRDKSANRCNGGIREHNIQSSAVIMQSSMTWMILDPAQQWLKRNIYQSYHWQKTPHISPSQVSYGVSIQRIWEKIDLVIMALHYISMEWFQKFTILSICHRENESADMILVVKY